MKKTKQSVPSGIRPRRLAGPVYGAAAAAVCGLGIVAAPSYGAHEGLPFTEPFDDAHLSDPAPATTADWGVAEPGLLRLPSAASLSAPFSIATPAEDVGDAAFTTRSLAVGDMNGDGFIDIVEAAAETNGVFLNDGAGNFPVRLPLGPDVANSRGIAVGDVNGDGYLDAVVGNLNAPLRLYTNSGDGVQYVTSDISNRTWPVDSVVVEDLNGDGHLDVAAAVQGNNFDRIFFNTGDPSAPFGEAGIEGGPIGPITQHGQAITAGDVDNDGDTDLVVIHEAQTNLLHLNDGTGTFTAGTPIGAEMDNSQAGALGDLNGDGFLDLVVGNYVAGQPSRIYFNTGDPAAPFTGVGPTDLVPPDNMSFVHGVTLGDVNQDGHLDILLSTAGTFAAEPGVTRFTNRLFLNDGAGGFATMVEVGAETDVTNSSVIADFDGNGTPDIVFGNEGRDAANAAFGVVNRLYRNQGTADGAVVPQLSAKATSLRVDTSTSPIATVVLTAAPESLGPHNHADFWISGNGGVNWLKAVPGRSLTIPEALRGTDLRWRVHLSSLSPVAASTLALDSVSLALPVSFTSTPVTEATEAVEYAYTVETTDPEGDARTITAPTLPAWLTLTDNGDGTATLVGTPAAEHVGSNPVELLVQDAGGSTGSQSFAIEVAAAAAADNAAPVFTSTAPTAATEGAALLYEVAAADDDGDALVLTAPTLPAWLTFTDNGDGTGTLTGTPAAADVGDHGVVLDVADAQGATAQQSFTVTVAAAAAEPDPAPADPDPTPPPSDDDGGGGSTGLGELLGLLLLAAAAAARRRPSARRRFA